DACGLLADGAPMVLLVACDSALPELFAGFADCHEQPHAWAWLMVPAADDAVSLSWSGGAAEAADAAAGAADAMPGGLAVLRFHLSGARQLERHAERRRWRWSRDV
ncbi:MAG: beta-ketoacyl synthase chain length factor, partial [Pseudomonadota bacterium]